MISIMSMAQTETTDPVKTQQLDGLVAEASNQFMNAEVLTFIIMARQKNAAKTL